MSDSFFQKKRKRSGDVATSQHASRAAAANGRQPKAGPSRLRMREKSDGGGKSGRADIRKGHGDSDEGLGDDDEDSDDAGVLDDMDLRHQYESGVQESDEDDLETPAEAKVRLAKLYLDGLRDDELDPNDADAAEADRQNIAARLQADVSSQTSHIHNFVAEKLKLPEGGHTANILACRGHKLSVTSAVIEPSCKSLWTAGKDGMMIQWRVKDGKMLEMVHKSASSGDVVRSQRKQVTSMTSGAARRRARAAIVTSASLVSNGNRPDKDTIVNGHKEPYRSDFFPSEAEGHTNEIWSLAISSDGKYLASGGKDKRICIWSLENGQTVKFVKALGGHKDSITGLRFRTGSHDLFTASADRTLKLFDVSQLSYIETLFGHQEEVAAMDLLRGEVAVSAGSRDRTVRWWKVREESQLVFRGGAKSKVREVLEGGDLAEDDDVPRSIGQEQWVEGSIDAVAMIDEHTFLSGGDSGTISLWSLSKKKPIFTVAVAHGFHTEETATEGKVRTPRWITSLACLPYGDVFASGSWDGSIRLWRLSPSLKSFNALHQIPVLGVVNSLQLLIPSRNILKKQQGQLIQEDNWRRRGGLQGGAKKIFAEVYSENGDTPSTRAEGDSVLFLVAAVGDEPCRGRWLRMKEAKNGAVIVPLYFQPS